MPRLAALIRDYRTWVVAFLLAFAAHTAVVTIAYGWGAGGHSVDDEPVMIVELPPEMEAPQQSLPVPVQPAATPKSGQLLPVLLPEAEPVTPPKIVSSNPVPEPRNGDEQVVKQPVIQNSPAPTPSPLPTNQRANSAANNSTSQNTASNGSSSGQAEGGQGDAKSKKVEADYKSLVGSYIRRKKFSPPESRKAGIGGNIKLSFTVDRSGRIGAVNVANGSGNPTLDREAVSHLQSISPVPAFPRDLRKNEVFLAITLKYDVKQK